MKYLQLFTLLIFMSSCFSTKRIAGTPQEKTPEVIKVKDSLIDNTKPIETATKTVEIIQETAPANSVDEVNDDEISEVFNHNNWNNLLHKYVSNQGKVNYKGFKTDRKTLLNYITSLSENMPNDSWTKEDKLAYWINAYNAMTIDLILRHYPTESIKNIKDPWDQRYWKLGGEWYNLNEIEHDILRKMEEPRIHFGIVCASFSCPKLQNRAFTADNLNNQLTLATKEFLSDSNRNEISENSIKLSKIFQWFAKDFKQNGNLIDFLNKYSSIKISAKAKKSFKDYDWTLNE